jgi:hypothetical protein
MAAGVVITLMVLLGFISDDNLGPYISVAFLLAGLVCTARLINSDHNPIEVYSGLLIGIAAQLIAYFFVK